MIKVTPDRESIARSGRWSSATLHTVANCIYYFALPTYANFPRSRHADDHAFHETKKSGSAAGPHRKLSTAPQVQWCTLSKT